MLQGSVQAVSVSDDAPRVALRAVDKRKPLEIESALLWTYRYELPKGSGGSAGLASVHPMFRGHRVDESRDPGFPDIAGQPHPDAATISTAVDQLENYRLDWKQDRVLIMPDLIDWAMCYDQRPTDLIFQPAELVKAHARMATRPEWNLGRVRVVRVSGTNNKPLLQFIDHQGNLVEGRTSARHYGSGARCVCRLDPPLRDLVFARAEYFVWHRSVVFLAKKLAGWKLRDHVVTPPVAAAEPWIVDTEIKSRILRSER